MMMVPQFGSCGILQQAEIPNQSYKPVLQAAVRF
jgi:hypothetical protein